MLTSLLRGAVFGSKTGDRPPNVLALHGWGRSHEDWRPVLTGLDALAVDLPGFGTSPAPETAIGSKDYAAILAPLLSDLRRPRVIAGHSFGGRVAIQLAAMSPDLVDHMVITGAPLVRGPVKKPSMSYRLLRTAANRGVVPQALLESVRSKRGSQDYAAASGVMRDILVRVVNEDYTTVFPGVGCPVELVYGALDSEAPLERAKIAQSRLRDARLTVIEGAGHAMEGALAEAVRRQIMQAIGESQDSSNGGSNAR